MSKILDILNNKELTSIEKETQLIEYSNNDAVSAYEKRRLISISDAVKEMVAKRPSYAVNVKLITQCQIDGRTFSMEEVSAQNISVVSLAYVVANQANKTLHKSLYEVSDGAGHPAKYPHDWLIDTLRGTFNFPDSEQD